MKKLVSIIVPIYNREQLINKCVDSLINQTYKNIEIILVDDGSKDNTSKVIKEYAKKYKTVTAYSKENGGVGSARNYGLDKATGDYIIFVDSDDYLDNDFVEVMIKNIGKNDIIVSGFKNVNNEGVIIKNWPLLTNNYAIFRYPTIWAKMYNAKVINKYNLRFSDLRLGEDVRFTLEYLSYINNGTSISYIGYNNLVGEHERITTNKKDIASRKIDNTLKDLDILLDKDNYKNKYKNQIYYFVMKELLVDILTKSKYSDYKELKTYNDEEVKYIKDIFKKHNLRFRFCFKHYDSIFNHFIINLYVFAYYTHTISIFLRLLQIYSKR